jgi:hypothetical protein
LGQNLKDLHSLDYRPLRLFRASGFR